MKVLISTILAFIMTALLLFDNSELDTQSSSNPHYESPDLVVGLIVDQMRPDYIYKYWDQFGEGGIKRLVNNGTSFRNAYFRQLQTSTGPGHAAQLTGASPMVHGLIGNSWYVPELDRSINVIEDVDSGYKGVGSEPDYPGEKSPANMLTTSVGDELYMFTGERSKSIGISRKDRGAILPAGHTGNAYWYEGATGNFITSTYYMDRLPDWVQNFNDRNLPQEYLSGMWEPLLPIEEYVQSRPDDNIYEGTFPGMDTPTFPVDLARIVEEEELTPSILNLTPFADELLFKLAVEAIEGEQLGQREVTDILSIALSASDAIGHRFGPGSTQVQDYYLRLDQYIADFLNYLNQELGMENVLIYLTADHGAVYIPHYMSDLGIPTGHENFEDGVNSDIVEQVEEFMRDNYGHDFLLNYSNQNIYLDHDFIRSNNLDIEEVRKDLKRFVLTLDSVGGAITADVLNRTEFTEGMRARAMHLFHQKRSGDLIVWLQPQTRGNTGTGGTGHGTGWVYDTHIPLIFYGYNIPYGQSNKKAYVSDIASTVSVFLNTPFPSGNTGNPLNDYMK